MKISLIFGLIHMVFGVTLSAWQKVLKRKYAEIFVEFIPQLVFLVFIFCYLILLIFFKWVSYSANVNLHGDPNNDRSEHCAPNLLITFINMMMFKAQYTKMDIIATVSKFNLRKADLIRLGQVWLLLFLLISLFIYFNPRLRLAIEKKMANPSLGLK